MASWKMLQKLNEQLQELTKTNNVWQWHLSHHKKISAAIQVLRKLHFTLGWFRYRWAKMKFAAGKVLLHFFVNSG